MRLETSKFEGYTREHYPKGKKRDEIVQKFKETRNRKKKRRNCSKIQNKLCLLKTKTKKKT
jgi:hypothetical protein